MTNHLTKSCCVILLLTANVSVQASYWKHSLVPYLWFDNYQLEQGNVDLTPQSQSYGDYFDAINFNLGTRVFFDHLYDGFVLDVFYQDINSYGLLADQKLFRAEFFYYKKNDYVPGLKLTGGFRYHDIRDDSVAADLNWSEAFAGAIGSYYLFDDISFNGQLDFGVSESPSGLNWRLMGHLLWAVNDNVKLGLGYQVAESKFKALNFHQQGIHVFYQHAI